MAPRKKKKEAKAPTKKVPKRRRDSTDSEMQESDRSYRAPPGSTSSSSIKMPPDRSGQSMNERDRSSSLMVSEPQQIPSDDGQQVQESTVDSNLTTKASGGDNEPIRGIDAETLVTMFDGTIVKAGDLQDGDKLMGIDGSVREVSNVKKGQATLYKIQIKRMGYYHGLDLLATADCILHVQSGIGETTTRVQIAAPTDVQHKSKFGVDFGAPLSSAATQAPFSTTTPLHKTRTVQTYSQALRKAVAWLLGAKGPEDYAGKVLRNAINGIKGIIENTASPMFIYRGGKGRQKYTFSWGLKTKDDPTGRIQYYKTREEAFDAARERSAQDNYTGAITWRNLHQRYLEKLRHVKKNNLQRLKIDENVPGLIFKFTLNGTTTVSAEYGGDNVTREDMARDFEFSSWTDVESDSQSDDHPAEDNGGAAQLPQLPQLSAAYSVMHLKTVSQLMEYEVRQHAIFVVRFSEGFPYQSQNVTVNPYYLGLWLGDGARSAPVIFNDTEKEVVSFLVRYAAELKLHLSYYGPLAFAIVGRKTSKTVLPPLKLKLDRMPGRRLTYHAIHAALLNAGYVINTRGLGGQGQGHLWQAPEGANLHKIIAPAKIQTIPQRTLPPFRDLQEDYEANVDDAGDSRLRKRNRQTSSPELIGTPVQSDETPRIKRRLMTRNIVTSSEDNLSQADQQNALLVETQSNVVVASEIQNEAATGSGETIRPTIQMPSSPLANNDSQSSGNKSISSGPSSQILPPLPKRDGSHLKRNDDLKPIRLPSNHSDRSPLLLNLLSSDPGIRLQVGKPQVQLVNGEDELDNESSADDESEETAMDLFEIYQDPDVEDVQHTDEAEEDLVSEQEDTEKQPRGAFRLKSGEGLLDGVDASAQEDLAQGVLRTTASSRDMARTSSFQPREAVNTLMVEMRKLGVMSVRHVIGEETDQKHIPDQYLFNDEATRLQVLAGLLDADGCLTYHSNYFIFVQNKEWHEHLFRQVVLLALGLGFRVATFERTYAAGERTRHVLRLEISGLLEKIPCLLSRKQASPRYFQYKVLVPMGSVEQKGFSDYVSFDVDKDHYYLRNDRLLLVASNGYDAVDGMKASEYLEKQARQAKEAAAKQQDNTFEPMHPVTPDPDCLSQTGNQEAIAQNNELIPAYLNAPSKITYSLGREVMVVGARFVSPGLKPFDEHAAGGEQTLDDVLVPELSLSQGFDYRQKLSTMVTGLEARELLLQHEMAKLQRRYNEMNEKDMKAALLKAMEADDILTTKVSDLTARKDGTS